MSAAIRIQALIVLVSTAFCAPAAEVPLALAENGKTEYTIVYDFDKKDVLLDPVVRDLADTLHEITGAEFPVKPQTDGPAIHIGKVPAGDNAEFAARELIDLDDNGIGNAIVNRG